MPGTDIKSIVTFITSAKSVYRQVVTDATECMYAVLSSTLHYTYGENWFNSFKNFAPKSLKAAENIYFCNLKMLLLAFLESDEIVNLIFKNTVDQKQDFLSCIKTALVDFDTLTEESVTDINDTKWEDSISHLQKIVDFFPCARNNLGETFISKVAVHNAQLKKFDKYMPTYDIAKTIESESLQISVSEFIEHCLKQEITIITQDQKPCFCTKEYDTFLIGVKEHIAVLLKAKQKKERKILFMKIAVIALAVILTFISAFTSNSITRLVIKDNGKIGSNNNSQTSDNSNFNSSKNESSSKPSSSSNDSSDSLESSTPSNTSSDTSSQQISNNGTTVDKKGRITDVSTAKYRYEKNDWGSDFNEYSTTVNKQEIVYIEPYKNYLNYNSKSFRIRVVNNTESMVRNISIEIILYDEHDNKIFSYSESNLTEENATVSIKAKSSDYFDIDISDNNLYNKDADFGFTKLYSKISYDILQ